MIGLVGYRFGGCEGGALPPLPRPAIEPPPGPGPELCMLLGEYRSDRFPEGGAWIEEKRDGIRALFLRGELITRTGMPIRCADALKGHLLRLERRYGEPVLLDGEYVEPGGFEATARAWRQPVEGKGTYWIHDALPLSAWDGRAHSGTLEIRKARLKEAFGRAPLPRVALTGWAEVDTHSEVVRAAQDVWARGGEGVVVKRRGSLYRCARSMDWMKLKRTVSFDVEVVAVAPQRKEPDMLGALIVRYAGGRSRVAAGFTDKERRILWALRDELVGRIAEVDAMGATDAGLLRHAVFKRWRHDRTGTGTGSEAVNG